MKISIVMIGGPFDKVVTRLNIRLKLFSELYDDVYLVIDQIPDEINIPNGCKVFNIMIEEKHSLLLSRPFEYILMSIRAFRSLRNRDGPVLVITGIPYILPFLILCRLSKKNTILLAGGGAFRPFIAQKGISLLSSAIYILEKNCWAFTRYIGIENQNAAKFIGISGSKRKILEFGNLVPLDTTIFHCTNEYSSRAKTITYIGALTKAKGVDALIQTARIAIKKGIIDKFVFMGEGEFYDDIIKLSKESDCFGRVSCLKWSSREDVSNLLNESRLNILNSRSEGLPTIVLESMSCGTPVLASNVGGLGNLINDFYNGFLMDSDDPNAIVSKIAMVLSYGEISEVIENAIKTSRYYDYGQTKARMQKEIARTIENKRRLKISR